jgi:hypothetical protein
MSTGGKGSRPRPFSVDQKTFDSNWDAIFKRKIEEEIINEVSKLIADETLQATEPKAENNK